MTPRKIHFAATEPLTEAKDAEVIDEKKNEVETPGVSSERGESGETISTGPTVSPAPVETKSQRKSQKRCVVCKRGVENCECKGGPLTREEYEALISARSGEGVKSKKKEHNPQSVEDMARTLLFFYSKGGSWLSALACRVSAKQTDEIWAISESKCAEILPPSVAVLERYWDKLPSWLSFLQEHMAEFMLGKALVEMTVANIHATIELRREVRKLSGVAQPASLKSKSNGVEQVPVEQVM